MKVVKSVTFYKNVTPNVTLNVTLKPLIINANV